MPVRSHVLDPYPKGWQNPIVARTSAALPAGGAWDASPTEFVTAYATQALIAITYTQGGQDGAMDWQVELSPYSSAALVPTGASEWIEQTALAVGGVTSGADTQSLAQAEYQTFDPASALAETVILAPIDMAGIIERMRIRARESGSILSPGTCQITVQLQ